jgi:hypothetical protein
MLRFAINLNTLGVVIFAQYYAERHLGRGEGDVFKKNLVVGLFLIKCDNQKSIRKHDTKSIYCCHQHLSLI